MPKQKELTRGFKPFLSLIASTHFPKSLLAFGLIGTVISTVVSLLIPILTKEIVDGFSLTSFSVWIIVAIVAAFLGQAILDGISTYILGAVGQRVIANLRQMLWKKVVRLPIPYFDQTPTGNTISRIINDTGILKDLISRHFPQFIGGLISIIGAVIILIILDWKMTLIMFIAVPLTVACMIPLGRAMAKVSRQLQDETANFTSTIQQAINENRLMKTSTAEEVEIEKGNKGVQTLFRFGLKETKIMAMIGPLMYLIVMIVIVVIIGYGGIRVASGSMSTGALVAFLLYLFQIVFPITSFAMFFTELQKAQGATERIIEILHMENEQTDGEIHQDISHAILAFDKVSFAYNKGEPVLQELDFQAIPGEMTAIVGPSGSGKTTIFNLIEQFYVPTAGNITIDHVPITQLSLNDWRKQIGYVSQESAMMAGTIRDNLTYGLEQPEAITDDTLWEVAKMAYADTFIKEFKQGLDTEIGERGIKLSGGQRQRINIARAFLRDPKILMLDEATASLDSQSEQIVQEALSRLMVGRTTLVIAHRLSTIVHADQIIFMDKGVITGIGTHTQLMQTHPLYAKFAKQQLTS